MDFLVGKISANINGLKAKLTECELNQGCQIFLCPKYQNGEKYTKLPKIYQMAIKYFQWALNRPNGHKIYQNVL
jgi:hypothetical protein